VGTNGKQAKGLVDWSRMLNAKEACKMEGLALLRPGLRLEVNPGWAQVFESSLTL
jgi:hypothetical protein